MAPSVNCRLSKHKHLASVLRSHTKEPDVVGHICQPNPGEVEAHMSLQGSLASQRSPLSVVEDLWGEGDALHSLRHLSAGYPLATLSGEAQEVWPC